VDGISQHRRGGHELTNIAVPSLVAYPPVFKHVTAGPDGLTVMSIDLCHMPLDPDVTALYLREAEREGLSPDTALAARDYGSFLQAHTHALVTHRYFPREWPEAVVEAISSMTVADLCSDPSTAPQIGRAAIPDAWQHISVIDLVTDWYCLRQAGTMGKSLLGLQKLELMRTIAARFVEPAEDGERGAVAGYLETFFRSMLFFVERAERLDGVQQFELRGRG
jgi:hypothetical protein